jgi:hypothetical protein
VALRESRTAIRQQFVQNAGAASSGSHFEGLLQMADEAADMLLRGIVQGRLNERTGHYGTNESAASFIVRNLFSLSCVLVSPCAPFPEVKFEPEHVVEDMSYVEPITQETVQRLQKPMVQKTASNTGATCGGSH